MKEKDLNFSSAILSYKDMKIWKKKTWIFLLPFCLMCYNQINDIIYKKRKKKTIDKEITTTNTRIMNKVNESLNKLQNKQNEL